MAESFLRLYKYITYIICRPFFFLFFPHSKYKKKGMREHNLKYLLKGKMLVYLELGRVERLTNIFYFKTIVRY